jgi:hypothetical protein
MTRTWIHSWSGQAKQSILRSKWVLFLFTSTSEYPQRQSLTLCVGRNRLSFGETPLPANKKVEFYQYKVG